MPSETPVDAGRRKSAKRAASTEVGIGLERHLDVAARRAQCRSAASITAATVAGAISEGVPPPKKIEVEPPARRQRALVIELGEQRLAPARLVDRLADMAVEVAIGALGQAERPVDVEGEAGPGPRSFARQQARGDQLARRRAARWLMACFSAGSISPNVMVAAGRHEHRVVAEAALAARRPDQRAVDLALEASRTWPSGQAQRQRADELGARRSGVWPPRAAARARPAPCASAKSLSGPGPARRVDAGRAVQRRRREAGIVGQRRQRRRRRRRPRLELGIGRRSWCRSPRARAGRARPADTHPMPIGRQQLARSPGPCRDCGWR